MLKWNNEYQVYVSDDGHVYNKDMKEYTLRKTSDNMYYKWQSCRNGKVVTKNVHRLVYETFVGPIPDDLVIDHINRNGLDNNLSNLRAVTVTENNRNRVFKRNKKPHGQIP